MVSAIRSWSTKEGYNLFQHLLASINNEITHTFFKYAKHAVDMKVQAELGRSVFQKAGLILQGAQKRVMEAVAMVAAVEVAPGFSLGPVSKGWVATIPAPADRD